jgi:hypothetical protein
VCNAKEHAEKWSGKEIAAQNVRELENYEIFIKNYFLLAIILEPWRFMSSTIARWKVLENEKPRMTPKFEKKRIFFCSPKRKSNFDNL